ncbi:MAG: VWA containing CoxE family protein [Eubacteriales bacterium]|nr:VWA containing CoxE family protein [Eubacteriales bacterium]
MFDAFFYLLRQYGLDVSTTEWLTVQQALSLGLHGSSLTGFYDLCRAILCKSESEYDKFDQAFEEYFYDVFYTATGRLRDDLPEDVLAMLQRPNRPDPLQYTHTLEEEAQLAALRRRAMEEQEGTPIYEDSQAQLEGEVFDGSHNIRPDDLPQGNPEIIQVVRKPRRKPGHALPLWNFKDFREDNVLNIRQFQMAFRRLCLYSDQFGPEVELDIQRTVHDTCQKGGLLQIRQKKPRRNAIKVLMFIDCGGTMTPYHALCSRLFQAVSRSNRFKDLKIYYFHNCIDEYLYTNPTLRLKYEVSTKKVLRECDKDYKVIFVGDATMDVNELLYPPAEVTRNNQGFSGQDWLNYILKRYRSTVWLTPVLRKKGSCMGTWGAAYDIITDLFQMYPLTVKGLEDAMEQLMVQK